MNVRAIAELTKKIGQYTEESLEYIEKKKQIEAKILSTFQAIKSYTESLNNILLHAVENKSVLSDKEYTLYIRKIIEEFYFNAASSDNSDSEGDEIDPLVKTMTTLINFKMHLNDIEIELNTSAVENLISLITVCQNNLHRLFDESQDKEFIKAAKKSKKDNSSSSSSSEPSSDNEEEKSASRKRKFEDVAISSNPDTLFSSESKKAKIENTPDNFVPHKL